MKFACFIAVTVLLLHSPAIAIAENSIARSYELLTGGASCAMNVVIKDKGPSIAASKITMNGAVCSGPTIQLQKLTANDSGLFTIALAPIADAANIHTAYPESRLTCGNSTIESYTSILFAAPSFGDVQLPKPFLQLAGELDLGEVFKFIDGQAYMLVGQNCMYMSMGDMPGGPMDDEEMTEDAMASEAPMEGTCFPADATVTLGSGEARRMDELRVGDEVHVGKGKTSPIFAWTHQDANYRSSSYVRISAGDKAITITPSHYVYANGRAMPAEKVRKGDTMFGADGKELLEVTEVTRVAAAGLYNPQTLDGDIVVDGFSVTTYTTAVTPNVAHAFLVPVRAGYSAISTALLGFSPHTHV